MAKLPLTKHPLCEFKGMRLFFYGQSVKWCAMWFPKNKRLRQLMVAGFVLRALPLLVWINTWPCVGDECTYLRLAERMSAGQGMTSSVGWLWAPGYPTLLALSDFLTGWGSNIKIAQLIVSTLLIAFMFRLGKQISGSEAWGFGLRVSMRFLPLRFSLRRVSGRSAFMGGCFSLHFGCSTACRRSLRI